MHEMSLAMSLMDLARHEVDKAGRSQLTGLEIDLGEQSGVDPDAFHTAVRVLAVQAGIPETEVCLRRIEARAECLMCGTVFRPSVPGVRECPACGSGQCIMIAGTELRLVSVRCR